MKGGKTLTTVFVAGTFNIWKNNDIALTKTDSGWYTKIKLAYGKHLYKFIIDGNWWTNIDNSLKENDGEGNINSVYYFTNSKFILNGFNKAKKVILSGSFKNWNERELKMIKTQNGWELPLYLANGTYTYRFIVDKKWIIDSSNVNKVPNEYVEFNSIISVGKADIFKLNGFTNAKKVILTGSFNNWNENELQMQKTTDGWEYAYVLGNGNFEYRFIVDGKSIGDTNVLDAREIKNFTLTLNPNYTFEIKGLENAKKIFHADDFNNWSTNGFEMKRVDGA